MCHVLGVSENGYYNWRKRGKSKRKQDDEYVAQRIEDAYRDNRGVYGSPRIHAELKAQGIHCGRKRIMRLMQEKGISASRERDEKHEQRTVTTILQSLPICSNVISKLLHPIKNG
jgi:putative transposase